MLLLWFVAQITSYSSHKLYYCSLGFTVLQKFSELADTLIYKAMQADIYTNCVSVSTCVMSNTSSGSARRHRVGSAILFYRDSSVRLKIEEIRLCKHPCCYTYYYYIDKAINKWINVFSTILVTSWQPPGTGKLYSVGIRDLFFGHMLKHYIFRKKENPPCVSSKTPVQVEHLLTETHNWYNTLVT